MSLQQLIQQGGYASPQEAYDAITAVTVVQLDERAWTLGLMQGVLGPELTLKVAGVLQAVGASNALVNSAYIAASTVGLQLSGDDRQAMIEQVGLAGGLSSAEIAQVKALGKTVKAPWQVAGIDEPTLQDVQAVWSVIELEQQWATQLNEVIQPASSDRATLVAALRQAALNLEA